MPLRATVIGPTLPPDIFGDEKSKNSCSFDYIFIDYFLQNLKEDKYVLRQFQDYKHEHEYAGYLAIVLLFPPPADFPLPLLLLLLLDDGAFAFATFLLRRASSSAAVMPPEDAFSPPCKYY